MKKGTNLQVRPGNNIKRNGHLKNLNKWLWAPALMLAACTGPKWDTVQAFHDGCWNLKDTLVLDPTSFPSKGLYLNVELKPDYPYRNIYLKGIAFYEGGIVHPFLLGDTLVDELGYWMEKPQSGVYSTRFDLTSYIHLKEKPLLQLKITQFMRDSSLCNVQKAGFTFENTPN